MTLFRYSIENTIYILMIFIAVISDSYFTPLKITVNDYFGKNFDKHKTLTNYC